MKTLNYVIVFVSDMQRSVAFYRDVLGLPLKFESPHWTEFANEGSTIALHPAEPAEGEGHPSAPLPSTPLGTGRTSGPSPTQAQGSVGAGLVPARNTAGTAQLGFQVENLDEWHKKLAAQSVKVIMEPRAEQFGSSRAEPRGIRQAVYADPDGLRFTLAESVKK